MAPDLRDARVFVSIVGDQAAVDDRFRWLRRRAPELREELSQRIVLKFLPQLTYVLDKSSDRVAKLLNALDQIPPAQEPDGAAAEPGHG